MSAYCRECERLHIPPGYHIRFVCVRPGRTGDNEYTHLFAGEHVAI